ncbi:MAG: N-acetylglucosamine-6-phosphate deacetylase [Butyrivibrio sp.]|nr:N-acetylglucosamine-6-phosphate deacetylase [Butyrivibrio sp.]
MIIKNGSVFNGKDFENRDICINNGRISDKSGDARVLDAEGMYVVPGFIDIHFHGAVGCDFCDADCESLRKIAEYEAANGVLAICPATMTFGEEKLSSIIENAVYFKSQKFDKCSDFVGINMEGPFISRDKAGAQNPEFVLNPDFNMFNRLREKGKNLVKLVDIAPETEGAIDFIKKVSGDVVVSIAHTCADYDISKKAFENGASHVTHLFNAMPGINHRLPGPIIAAHEAGADVELIADGIHVHPAMVRFTFDYFGSDKVILISDTMEGAGLPDGNYSLGGQKVIKNGKKAVLEKDINTIAGSVTNLYECFKTVVLEMNIPVNQALKAVTINPARSIHIDSEYGSLDEGKVANILVLDEKLNIKKIVLRGEVL